MKSPMASASFCCQKTCQASISFFCIFFSICCPVKRKRVLLGNNPPRDSRITRGRLSLGGGISGGIVEGGWDERNLRYAADSLYVSLARAREEKHLVTPTYPGDFTHEFR